MSYMSCMRKKMTIIISIANASACLMHRWWGEHASETTSQGVSKLRIDPLWWFGTFYGEE